MSEPLPPLNFSDLTRYNESVPIGSVTYILREASGDAAIKYRNACLKATKFSDGKLSALDGIADTEAMLVSLCLFETLRAMEGQPTGERNVPVSTVRSWPNRVQKALFDRIKKVSQLEDVETKDSLRKQISELKKKLDELEKVEREAGTDEDPTTSSHSNTTDG